VVTVGDAEVIVRIGTLIHAVGRSGSANGHDSGRTFCTLCLTDLFDAHHPCSPKKIVEKDIVMMMMMLGSGLGGLIYIDTRM